MINARLAQQRDEAIIVTLMSPSPPALPLVSEF
jgi:hypothetical protein